LDLFGVWVYAFKTVVDIGPLGLSSAACEPAFIATKLLILLFSFAPCAPANCGTDTVGLGVGLGLGFGVGWPPRLDRLDLRDRLDRFLWSLRLDLRDRFDRFDRLDRLDLRDRLDRLDPPTFLPV
jgi:hypothetical protein